MNTGKMGTKLMDISDLEMIYNASTQGEWQWNIEYSGDGRQCRLFVRPSPP